MCEANSFKSLGVGKSVRKRCQEFLQSDRAAPPPRRQLASQNCNRASFRNRPNRPVLLIFAYSRTKGPPLTGSGTAGTHDLRDHENTIRHLFFGRHRRRSLHIRRSMISRPQSSGEEFRPSFLSKIKYARSRLERPAQSWRRCNRRRLALAAASTHVSSRTHSCPPAGLRRPPTLRASGFNVFLAEMLQEVWEMIDWRVVSAHCLRCFRGHLPHQYR